MPIAPPPPAAYPGHMPVPTMLTRTEVDYLYWIAAEYATGAGRIIDLGCFLGGSTMALATGMAHNPRARSTLLTCDAFIMDPHSAATFPVGCAPGDSFRPVFDAYLKPHLPRITVREGYIPTELSGENDERSLYPEQEPVEILFIDIAKAWLVHNTILSTFGRHLIPGRSILVQQDFKHFGVYWIALHMLQLAPCFQPLHDVPGASTVSFLYSGGIERHLPHLWKPGDIAPPEINTMWDRVDAQWEQQPAILPFMRLRRATHLIHAGLTEDGIATLEHDAPALAANADPRQRVELALAIDWALTKSGPMTPHHTARLRTLAESLRPITPDPDRQQRRQRRLDIIERCEHKNWTTVALYGAGRHTADLLASGWPHGRLNISAILDDHSPAPAIASIPILRPEALPHATQAVIISSDAAEPALLAAAQRTLARRKLPILPIYAPTPF